MATGVPVAWNMPGGSVSVTILESRAPGCPGRNVPRGGSPAWHLSGLHDVLNLAPRQGTWHTKVWVMAEGPRQPTTA